MFHSFECDETVKFLHVARFHLFGIFHKSHFEIARLAAVDLVDVFHGEQLKEISINSDQQKWRKWLKISQKSV